MTDWSVLEKDNMSPKIVDKQLKRDNIVRSAVKVFSRRGIYDFKMIDIAVEAGIGKGTLYEYFRSKEDIINGTYKLVMDDFTVFLNEKLDVITEPVEKLKAFIFGTFEFFELNRDFMRLIFDFWVAGAARRDSRFFLAGFDETYRETVKYIRTIIDEGIKTRVFKPVDSEKAASLLLAAMDGLLFQVVLGLHRMDSRLLSGIVNQTVLEGLTL